MVDSISKPEKRLKEHLDALITEMIDRGILYNDAVLHFEQQYITKMLKNYGGNLTKTARALGIHRNTLSSKLDKNSH